MINTLIFIALMTLLEHSEGQTTNTQLTQEDIRQAFDNSLKTIRDRQIEEDKIKDRAVEEQKKDVKHFHFADFPLGPEEKRAQLAGLVNLELLKYFKERYNKTLYSLSPEEKQMIRDETIRRDICTPSTPCKRSKYRTADGSCNNLKNPMLGSSYTAFKRLLPAEYDDGLSSLKGSSVNGGPLVNPRLLSTTVAVDVNRQSDRYTHLFPLFAQFLTHDITFLAFRFASGCCLDNRSLDAVDCANINVSTSDYFYSQFDVNCLPFARGLPAMNINCELDLREQFNKETSVIDGSALYGGTEQMTKDLRTFRGGKLSSNPTNEKVLPPNYRFKDCNIRQNNTPCVAAGDVRVNQHTMLSEITQLWFREHNRIAGILATLNLNWNDETLYQEARRIVAAMLQHIIYNELIPVIFGKSSMKKYGLDLQKDGFSYEYNENIDFSISSLFSGAVWRMGHSLIQGQYDKVTENRQSDGFYKLAISYNRPIPLYDEDDFDKLLRGAATQPSQRYDTFFTTGLSNHVFQNLNYSYGFDLVAFNIQRGRDMGLPSYTKLREFCKLKPIKTFEDLEGVMRKEAIDAFRQVYNNVNDIEVYLAGLAEIPEKGEFMGPVVQCISGRQFHELKYGDRFWYENGNMETSFTQAQLNEIRKSSLARVLCDNTNIRMMQKLSFHQINRDNPLSPCIGGFIPRMSLLPWIALLGAAEKQTVDISLESKRQNPEFERHSSNSCQP